MCDGEGIKRRTVLQTLDEILDVLLSSLLGREVDGVLDIPAEEIAVWLSRVSREGLEWRGMTNLAHRRL